MAAPIWKTPKGTLGTIQEQEFYELSLQAIVPDDATPSLNYKIIAGEFSVSKTLIYLFPVFSQ